MNKKYVFGIYMGLVAISVLVYVGFTAYSYIVKQCQSKYGLSYNEKRKELGIPLIPVNWSIKERTENFVGWGGDETKVGYKRKAVTFSGCNIDGELDVFNLSLQNGKKRLLEIQYNYPRGKEKATLIYTYQIDHYAKSISKMAADSILNAENIQRGY